MSVMLTSRPHRAVVILRWQRRRRRPKNRVAFNWIWETAPAFDWSYPARLNITRMAIFSTPRLDQLFLSVRASHHREIISNSSDEERKREEEKKKEFHVFQSAAGRFSHVFFCCSFLLPTAVQVLYTKSLFSHAGPCHLLWHIHSSSARESLLQKITAILLLRRRRRRRWDDDGKNRTGWGWRTRTAVGALWRFHHVVKGNQLARLWRKFSSIPFFLSFLEPVQNWYVVIFLFFVVRLYRCPFLLLCDDVVHRRTITTGP